MSRIKIRALTWVNEPSTRDSCVYVTSRSLVAPSALLFSSSFSLLPPLPRSTRQTVHQTPFFPSFGRTPRGWNLLRYCTMLTSAAAASPYWEKTSEMENFVNEENESTKERGRMSVKNRYSSYFSKFSSLFNFLYVVAFFTWNSSTTLSFLT